MKRTVKNLLFLLLILWVLIGIVKYPKVSLNSAYDGLMTWFNIVLPSLFPFFIISELLIEIGFVNFLGNAFKPIMKPIFNVSGEGAFPFSMGVISGYPTGAKVTSYLREKGMLSKTEAERTICFSSTSGPLFMLGAVSIGILNSPSAYPLILYPHYLGAITVGIIMRFYKRNIRPVGAINKSNLNIITSFNKDYSIGSVFGNCVKNSINTILLVGGFIIFYSVLTELLFVSNVFNIITNIINAILPINISKELLHGFIAGLLEVTTGCKRISALNIKFIYKIMIINFLIGWSGFSIHSQALSFISKTDINSNLYIFSKLLHGIFSTLYTLLLYNLKYKNSIETSFIPGPYIPEHIYSGNWPYIFMNSFKVAVFVTLYLLICSLIFLIIYKISSKNS